MPTHVGPHYPGALQATAQILGPPTCPASVLKKISFGVATAAYQVHTPAAAAAGCSARRRADPAGRRGRGEKGQEPQPQLGQGPANHRRGWQPSPRRRRLTAGCCEPTAAHPDSTPRPPCPAAIVAAQVEGCTTCDGRSVSIWDTYAAQPGKIQDGSTAAVATDMYR